MNEGLSDEIIKDTIRAENLFQYLTERSVREMASTCIRRLKALNDQALVAAIASQPSDIFKQICLYAMKKQYRLAWDFMITVIGTKYETFLENNEEILPISIDTVLRAVGAVEQIWNKPLTPRKELIVNGQNG